MRPAEGERVLEHALDHHRDEEQGDEIEEQRRHHLVDAEAEAEHQRAEQQQRAGNGAAEHQRRDEQRGGQMQTVLRAERGGGERANEELALGADIPEARAEGDGGGEAGQDQRRGAGQRLGNREPRAEGADEHAPIGFEHRRAGERDQDAGQRQRDDDGGDGRADAGGERHMGAAIETDHAASSQMPAIIRPRRRGSAAATGIGGDNRPLTIA